MVSYSFEYYDYMIKIRSEVTQDETQKKIKVSLFDMFAYGLCYIGLMTGPFYTFKTFQDMLYQDGSKISTVWPAVKNLKQILFFILPYLLLVEYYPLSYLESDDCLNHHWGVLHIIWTLVPTFTWFRWRFYIGWLLAESMCMTSGLGAYPYECKAKPGLGPTCPQVEFDEEKSAKEHNGDTHRF